MMEKDDNNARVERGREIKRKRESAREKRDEWERKWEKIERERESETDTSEMYSKQTCEGNTRWYHK